MAKRKSHSELEARRLLKESLRLAYYHMDIHLECGSGGVLCPGCLLRQKVERFLAPKRKAS